MTQDLNLQSLRQAAEAAIDQSDAIGEDEWYTASKNLSVFVPNPDLAYIAAASPASILALLGRLERAERELYCPSCKGSGEGVGMEGRGPDAYEVAITCPTCDGTGARSPAGAAVPEAVMDEIKAAREIAMRNVLEARIPECGRFGTIAQHLDWAINQLAAPPAPSVQQQVPEGEREQWWRALQLMECPYTEATSGGMDWQVSAHAWTDAIIAAMKVIDPRKAAPSAPAVQPIAWEQIAAWDEKHIRALATRMAEAVASNASVAPQLCFPHIYLMLKDEFAAPAEAAPVAQASQQPIGWLSQWAINNLRGARETMSNPEAHRVYLDAVKHGGADIPVFAAPMQQAEGTQESQRYRWLLERFIGCDFRWGADEENESGTPVIVFEIDKDVSVSADLNATIDRAISASKESPAQSQPAGPAKGGNTSPSEATDGN